ncbi:hypothetical protein ACJMK2_025317 [Sinanodonta woodiana]|uniref:Ig-like domain-containing protein n=1 Tax=Sinanodonta woodiana TaxID=1069815 RepID=A0ABD3XG58_SINWO
MLVAIASILYVFLSSGVSTVDAQGLSVTINEGDTINGVINTNTTITCSTTGATSVTWLPPNGFTINPALAASKYSINFNSITGTSTLTIFSVQTTDNGVYTCRAANSLGQSLNDTIQLTAVTAVLYDPLTVQSDNLYAVEGDNYTLICIASSVYAEAKVYWTLDAQILTTTCTSSVLFVNQYTKVCRYTRTNVQRSDDGKVFTCLASVPGTERWKLWTLFVKVRPTNPVITQTSATVQVGSTASWSCTTSGGNPTPTLIWQLDLIQIFNGGSYNIPASLVTEQTVNGYTTYTVTSTISWSLTSQDIGKLLYCRVTSLPAPSNNVASLVISTSATVTLTVEILNGDSVSATEGQSITLTCRVVGAGSISVTWFGPSQAISGPKYAIIPYSSNLSQSTLTISNLDSTDTGTYTCLARTSASSSNFSDSVTLSVTAPLSVNITNGHTVNGTPGQSITLTCMVTGSGTITVIWIGLTGSQLLTNSKYTVVAYDTNSRQSSLTINSLTTSDAGTYMCRGSDSSGSALLDSVQLTVTAPLSVRITNGPTVTATVGQSVTVTCEVTGSGTISVMWTGPTNNQLFTNVKYNVGAYNSNTRQSTLTINSGATSDAGTYKCRGSDSYGSLEDSTQITYIVSMTVTIDEGDMLSKLVGSDATITCSVSGSGTISVVWIGPFGNTLTSNGKYTVTSYNINTGKSTITILGLLTTDSGSYICRATDGFGFTVQDSITLTAYAPLSVDIINGLTVNGTPGQSITLTCMVTGSGTITVVWIGLTGVQLVTNSKYTVVAYDTNSRQSSLTINSLTTSDAGTYMCRGSDSSGSTLLDTVQLTVTAPLSVRITNGPTVTATEGLSVTVTCEVTGSGTISVTWFGPTGNQLLTNIKYNVGAYNSITRQSTLTINSGTTSDAGTYRCRGSDSYGSLEDSTELTFIVPLSVSIDNGNTITGVNGGSITITCSVLGTGTITVTWVDPLQNIISSSSKYTISSYNYSTRKASLAIQSLSINDVGYYTCRASDSSGTQIEKSIYVTTAILTAVINEAVVFANVGENTVISCTVTGSYQSITWYRANTLVSNGQKFQISQSTSSGLTQSSLTVINVQYSDAAIYTCNAVSSIDGSTSVSDSVTLSVGARPLVTIGLTTLSAFSGQDIRVNCTVTSAESVTVTWYVNNTVLPNAVTSPGSRFSWQNSLVPSLTISRAVVSDTGVYRCQAQNSYGTGSDTVQLTVEGDGASSAFVQGIGNAPSITVASTCYRANVSTTVTLDCTYSSGLGLLQRVCWFFNGKLIVFSNNFHYVNGDASKPALTISGVTPSDEGTYQCELTNSAGTTNSSFITLDVLLESPPVITVSQQSYQVDEGKSVTLNIIVNSAATVSWTRNLNSITPGQNGYNSFSANSPNLVILNASVSHAGTYIFTASNTGGSSQSPPISLSVTAIPVVTVLPKPVTGYVGQSVTIYCTLTQVTSISDITIAWYRNNIAISKGSTYSWSDTTTPNLQILNLDANQHPGTYRCTARSSAGTGYDETTLSVFDKPTVNAPTTSVNGNAGSTITLQATVTGSLITSVMWSGNGISLTNDGVNGRFSWTNQIATGPVDLTIRNLALNDTGTYICTVRNGAGSNELMIRLTVNAVPVVTVSPKPVIGYVGQNVTINCLITQVISISSITIAWFRNSIAISKGSTYSWSDTANPNLQISNLDANQHSGTYRCTATSSIGSGFDETNLTVIDKPALSTPSNTITGNEGRYLTLQATVAGFLITSIMWSFNGTNLTNDGVNGRFSWTNQNSAGPVDLIIRNLELSDTGTYVCTVRNAAGVNQLTIKLTVIASQPIITIPQSQYYAEEGGNMTLQCNVQGSLISGVAWTHNNAQLLNGSHYSWIVGNSPHLRIINITKNDTGNYVCSATNSAGGTATATTPINLDVQYGPVVTIDNTVTNIQVGQSVTLFCRVTANPKESSVVWTKVGSATPLTSISTGTSTNLVFTSMSLSDAGTYRCQASNTLTVTGVAGTQLRENYKEITLLVQSAPTNVVIAGGSSVSAQIGQTLRLNCSSDGSNPRYFWTFGGQNVSASSYFMLTVNNRLQSGNYFCNAYNEFGSKRSNAIYVDVLYAPMSINNQDDISIDASLNVSVTLNCTVDANPPNCTYTWYDGDTQTILKGPSTSNTYFVDMNSLSDFKVYRCKADNTVGSGQVRFTVKQATDGGTFQTGASTDKSNSLSQAAIAGIILGIIFFILLVIIIIVCCRTCCCHKDEAKMKVAPSEKKTELLHKPIVGEQKKTSEQGSDPFLASHYQSKPESAAFTSPIRQRAPDSYRINSARLRPLPSRQLNGGTVPILEPIPSHREDRKRQQHKTPGPRQGIPEKSNVEDRTYRSIVSAVSRKHVDLEEKGPGYGFEEEPRYTDLPYLKTIDYPGPIISFPNGETPQAFQIPSSRSTAMYDYEEPLTQTSLPSVRDTANLYEDEDKKKKKRRKKKKRHHRRHLQDAEQFGDEEPYPEGPTGTNPYLEIKDYGDIEVVPGRSADPYNRYSDV